VHDLESPAPDLNPKVENCFSEKCQLSALSPQFRGWYGVDAGNDDAGKASHAASSPRRGKMSIKRTVTVIAVIPRY